MDSEGKKEARAFRRILRRFERVHRTLMEERDCCRDLTIAQCHPLLEIDEIGQTNLGELASRLNLDPSTLSRTVEGLVKRGLVERRPDEHDRRFVVLSLTAEGQRACDEINERNDRFYGEILPQLRQEEREKAIRFFDDLVRVLTEAVAPCGKSPGNDTG